MGLYHYGAIAARGSEGVKVKIQILISCSLYLYHLFMNLFITGTIELLGHSALIQYIVCHFTGVNRKDI